MAVLLLTGLSISAQSTGGAQEAPPAPSGPATYVGSDTCQMCHEDVFNAFQRNPHHAVGVDKKRGWEGKACEACHGPGSKHAETTNASDILNPAKISPKESERDCLKCHQNQPTQVGRIMGSHARNNIACTNCHSIHTPHSDELVRGRTARINQLCAGCHVATWAQFQRPYTHRLIQGAMSCVDCHNPHGSLLQSSLRMVSANEPSCFNCHADKRGPFTFEHAPVKFEGCWQCHEPHGSANPRMLVRSEVRFVCLECHANVGAAAAAASGTLGGIPPAFHDLRSPRFRNCTICHIKIHGSYVDGALLR